jgi:hypothetical protein
MGILNYKYHCCNCNKERWSYFKDVPYCVYCNSVNITREDVRHLKIDKFSDEGNLLYYDKNLKEGVK